jgi:hypothetical protein
MEHQRLPQRVNIAPFDNAARFRGDSRRALFFLDKLR